MKVTSFAVSLLAIAALLPGCTQSQAVQTEWEASLLDQSEPWTSGDMSWLLSELGLSVYRFEVGIPSTKTVNVVWEHYQDGQLVSRNDGSHISVSSGLARGRVVVKPEDEGLRVSLSINGVGTALPFRSWKTLKGPQMTDVPGVISEAENPNPFFVIVGNDDDQKPLTSDNMYEPGLHDQALYMYIVRE